MDAPDDDRAVSLGNPAKIPTHVTGEDTDSRVPRPAKKTIKEPMVSQLSLRPSKRIRVPPRRRRVDAECVSVSKGMHRRLLYDSR